MSETPQKDFFQRPGRNRRPGTGVRNRVAFALAMGAVIGFVFMNVAPGLERLMALYGSSYTGISLLIGALLWAHALMQVPAGLLADRIGTSGTILTSLVCLAAGNFISASCPVLAAAACGRGVAGIGTGLGFVSTFKLIALYAPAPRVGMYQAFFAGFFSIGSIFCYIILPGMMRYGWYWVYLLPGLLSVMMIFWMPFLGLSRETRSPLRHEGLGHLISNRMLWILASYHTLSYGVMINLGNWVPSLLAETYPDSTATQLAWGGALVMLVSGVGRIIGGLALLRITPASVVNGSVAVLLLLFAGLFAIETPLGVVLLALAAAWFGSVNFGAIFHIASRTVATQSLATIFGSINFLANIGAVLFALLFGGIKDSTGSFSWAFAVLAALCAVALSIGRKPVRNFGMEEESGPVQS